MPGSVLASELITIFLVAKASQFSDLDNEKLVPEIDNSDYDVTLTVDDILYDSYPKPNFDFDTAWKLLESTYEELDQRQKVASEISKIYDLVFKKLQDLALGRSLASDLFSGTSAEEGANGERRYTVRVQSIDLYT